MEERRTGGAEEHLIPGRTGSRIKDLDQGTRNQEKGSRNDKDRFKVQGPRTEERLTTGSRHSKNRTEVRGARNKDQKTGVRIKNRNKGSGTGIQETGNKQMALIYLQVLRESLLSLR